MLANDLLQQILTFPIDEGNPDKTFEQRLSQENGWSLSYAKRVVTEYKRFVFLAMTAGHEVSPSEQVDQAWHLHLTYTHSYWDRLCKEVLGRPLHHNPTKGGQAESVKYRQLYEQTVASYGGVFGEAPPADIWPSANIRFGVDLRTVRVNTSQNWVISKSSVRRYLAACLAAITVFFFATGCGGAITNPFDLQGKEFFWVLLPAMAAAVVLGIVCRSWVKTPGPRDTDKEPDMDWAEIAYLAGGRERLTSAALARLVAAGFAEVSSDHKELLPVPEKAYLLEEGSIEKEVYQSLPLKQNDSAALVGLSKRTEKAFNRVDSLQEEGYLMKPEQTTRASYAAILPAWVVLVVLGIPRLIFGLDNGKPSGLLILFLFCVVVFGILTISILLRKNLSRRGSYVLSRLRSRGPRYLKDETDPETIARQVGLFGATAIAACTVAPVLGLFRWYPPLFATGNRGFKAGSDGGDYGGGCGGGGCGGGGCGGGCGGCGGS